MNRLLVAPLLAVACVGAAQIRPAFPYNGIHRPFHVKVSVPRGERGAVEIALLAGGTGQELTKKATATGSIDLGALFPELWEMKRPKLQVAQLLVGGRRVGSGLILQPMTNPAVSRLAADGKTVEFVPDEDQAYAGIRAWVDQDLDFETTLGNMRFRLRPDCAPNTAYNIRQLAAGGYYRDVIFHRVVALARGNPFVIQGGDPTGTGSGGPGFAYPLEDSSLPHDFGVISIARSTDPNTNGSQIFVCLSREGTARLDHKYASFGEAISGAEVILKIGAVKTGKEDRPEQPPVIRRVVLRDAAPYGTGPASVKRPATPAQKR